MSDKHQNLFDESLLLSYWSQDFELFRSSDEAEELVSLLENWAAKEFQKETTAETTFVSTFFGRIWGYVGAGEGKLEDGFTLTPRYPVPGAGQSGGTGEADLALGIFGLVDAGIPDTPQCLCEFKDVRSGLDAPQKRKGNDRSPVKQCSDYLRYANDLVHPSASIRPSWGVVTDMNEFRLYARRSMPIQYQRFVITSGALDREAGFTSLLEDNSEAEFQRFLFWKLFQADSLLSKSGPSMLELLLDEQFIHEKEIERSFYQEYRVYRERVFNALVKANPEFKGTRACVIG